MYSVSRYGSLSHVCYSIQYHKQNTLCIIILARHSMLADTNHADILWFQDSFRSLEIKQISKSNTLVKKSILYLFEKAVVSTGPKTTNNLS